MEYRSLGATAITVSRLGLGLAALGRPAYIDIGRDRDLGTARSRESMEARTHEVLDAAYEVGVRYLDAARSYGDAETFLGDWLATREPPDVVVGSKWGYAYVGDWRMDAGIQEVKDLTAATLRRQFVESRTFLGRPPTLYQIHSATIESGVFDDRAVLDELRSLRAAGLLLGFSTTGPRQTDTIRRGSDVLTEGEPLFSTVQSTWNPLEPSAGHALADAHAGGRGTLIKEAMANGRLAGTDGPLAGIAARLGTTQDRVAIAAALANPWADIVLSGAVTPDQVRSNAAASDLRLAPDDLAELGALAQTAERYWAERAELPWA